MTMWAAPSPLPSTVRQTDSSGGAAAAAEALSTRRVLAISTRLAKQVGDPAALVLLSQLLYWSRRGRDVQARDGWIFKTAAEWSTETGLSWKVQKRARQLLVSRGLIEERLQTMPARLEYRLCLPQLLSALGLDSAATGAAVSSPWAWMADSSDLGAGRLAQGLGRQFLLPSVVLQRLPLPCALLVARLLPSALAMSLGPQAGVIANWHQEGRYLRLHRQEWLGQTGLSRCQWQGARQHLLKLGLLQERQHNFPRRVDLALNLPALRALLKQPLPCRPEREKQAHGSVDSTKPTCSHRPIQPASLARSSLYPQVLQVLLPTTTAHVARELENTAPKPLRSSTWTQYHGPWPVPTLWRGWLQSVQHQDRLEEAPPEACALVWPPCLADSDQAAALAHLGGLGHAQAQQVLDEMAWQAQAKPIRSPVALLRTLVARAERGAFVPDGAHRVQAQRDSGPRWQRVLQSASPQAAVSPEAAMVESPPERSAPEALSPAAQQAKAALRDMAQRFRQQQRSAG